MMGDAIVVMVLSVMLSVYALPGYNSAIAQRPASKDNDFKVTLLGTGTPVPSPTAFGPSTFIEVAGQKLLFDVGRGATTRLVEIGAGPGKVDAVFITHMHSDHVVGFTDLVMTGWLPFPWGGRRDSLAVYGPPGIKNLAKGLDIAFEDDHQIRMKELNLPPEGRGIEVHTFDGDGVVYSKDGVVVTAITVSHGQHVKPAFGYRIDYNHRTVVLSGDTAYSQNLARQAQNVDLLIHEVFAASEEMSKTPMVAQIERHHTSPEKAGAFFEATKPKLAVFNHIATWPLEPPTHKEILSRSKLHYAGDVIMGEDKMVFFILTDTVTTILPVH